MAIRNIIKIDEELCNGCGNCITGCHEGALAIIDGKAKIVKDSLCDGLGACIGTCPTGALTIEQRDADDFDEAEVQARQQAEETPKPAHQGCPGSAMRTMARPDPAATPAAQDSALGNWPIQLHLIRPDAPYFQNADILIAADCTAFSFGAFHRDLLAGRSLIIACPKLDDPAGYVEKLTALFGESHPQSVTIARMQVPCCFGLTQLIQMARKNAGNEIKLREIVVGIDGQIISETDL